MLIQNMSQIFIDTIGITEGMEKVTVTDTSHISSTTESHLGIIFLLTLEESEQIIIEV